VKKGGGTDIPVRRVRRKRVSKGFRKVNGKEYTKGDAPYAKKKTLRQLGGHWGSGGPHQGDGKLRPSTNGQEEVKKSFKQVRGGRKWGRKIQHGTIQLEVGGWNQRKGSRGEGGA